MKKLQGLNSRGKRGVIELDPTKFMNLVMKLKKGGGF